MRTSALLLLSLMLLGACFAADQPAANSNQDQSSIPSTSPAQRFSYGANGASRLRYLPGNEPICLKLRTYVVRRVDPDSDVTRLHSYSTCTPAWKFQTRSAVLQETTPPERKLTY